MIKVGRWPAGVWFFTFCIVVINILLNMMLAILMESYAYVKAQAGNAQPLQRQISEMVRRRRQFKRGQRVRLNDIWNSFWQEASDEKELLQSDRVIYPLDLVERVKGMPPSQAKRTMKNAMDSAESSNGFDEDDVLGHMKHLEECTRMVKERVNFMQAKISSYDSMEVRDKLSMTHMAEEQAFVKEICATMHETVGHLSSEVGGVLSEEMVGLEARQCALEEQQAQMLGCIQDTHDVLLKLRQTSDNVSSMLEQQVIRKRTRARWRSPPPAGSPLPSCSLSSAPKDHQVV